MTRPPDPLDHKSLAQHAREATEAPVDSLRERVADLERRIVDAAEEAGLVAESRSIGKVFNEFARLIRKKSVKAGERNDA